MDRVGATGTTLTFEDPVRKDSVDIGHLDRPSAGNFLMGWLDEHIGFASLAAIGHPLVNGGREHREPEPVTPALLEELRRISIYAPEHLPFEIALIDVIGTDGRDGMNGRWSAELRRRMHAYWRRSQRGGWGADSSRSAPPPSAL